MLMGSLGRKVFFKFWFEYILKGKKRGRKGILG